MAFVRLAAIQHHRQQDILPGRQLPHQVVALEHKAEAAPAQNRELIVVVLGQIMFLIDDTPGRGPVQTGEQVQQGGFAAAALPRHGGKGALGKGQADIPQRVHGHTAALVGLREAFTAQCFHGSSLLN